MRHKLIIILAAVLAAIMPAQAEGLLAFPGAEGFGRFATGGRGGAIYHVTNLNDKGAGSLRDAVSQPHRIVVFDVCGTINLASRLVFSSNLTVLGQTAPGEGIQVYGNGVSFSGASNLIIRHMRFRMGTKGDSGKDAAGLENGHDMIFDHLSVLWGLDENFSINSPNNNAYNITIQNSIIGQGLQTHSCGGLLQTNGAITVYRNLYIENKTRNPKVKGINQFVNNVLYNWGSGAAYNMGGDSQGTSWTEITDNYWVKGPWKGSTRPLVGGNSDFHYYGDGNYYDSNLNGANDGTPFEAEVYASSGGARAASLDEVNAGMAGQTTGTEKSFPAIKGRMTAPQALAWVMDSVGASLPAHDEPDTYLLDELKSFGTVGTNNGISSEKLLPHKGTGTINWGVKPQDTDGDGIPDAWETAHGLNPNDATDAAAIAANGYANIENYVFTITSAYPYVKAPTGLQTVSVEKNAITVKWVDNSANETGFVVEMSTDGTNFTKVGETAANETQYKADNLPGQTIHYFRVYATGADGIVSGTSAVLKTTTIDQPYAPSQCKLVAPSNGAEMAVLNAELAWSNDTENYFGDITYTVRLGADKEQMEVIAEGITDTTCVPATELTPGTTYYWRVDATNSVGTTEGDVWEFKAKAGGILFKADFRTYPQEFAESEWAAYSAAGSDADLFGDTSGHNGEFSWGALTMGGLQVRIHLFGGRTNEGYSAADAGASKSSLGFVGKTGGVTGGYVYVHGMEGPCTVTVYTYNSDGAAMNYNVGYADEVNGETDLSTLKNVSTFSMAASKKVFKRTCTYDPADTLPHTIVINGFSIDNKGIEFNDIIVERHVKDESGLCAPTVSDDTDAEPVYYNLQGIRVSNPGPGLYIRRQGSRTDKVLIRE